MKRVDCRRGIKSFFKTTDYRHYICIGITVGFVLISIFCFRFAGLRLFESLRDFCLSIAYMTVDLFDLAFYIDPTVQNFSSVPYTVSDKIPSTFEMLKSNWSSFWALFVDRNNFNYFLAYSRSKLAFNAKISLIFFSVIFVFVLLLFVLSRFRTQNNNYNVDTKALRIFKKISDKTYRPVKTWIKSFFDFVRSHKSYRILWVLTWAFSFNFFAIFFDIIAFYYYFCATFDLASIFTQLYKLLLDLSPMYKFVPAPVWFLIGFWIFDKIRKSIGYNVLEHHEAMNRGFINEQGVFSLFVAPMRQGKTKASVAFALSREAMFRDMAFEIILGSDLKFPFFPWINLENALRVGMDNRSIYNLASIRRFIDTLRSFFFDKRLSDPSVRKYALNYLRKRYGYSFRNFSFDYDLTRYPIEFDNAKFIESLFDVIKDYAQAYFIYVIRSSLILSNFSIRTDGTIKDIGNLPLWDTDFFHVNSYDVDLISRHSHILDYDVLKLGKKIAGESSFAFEFGVIDITEIAKERLNMLEAQGIRKDDDNANQKNDGFDDWLKMCGHSAMVGHTCFVSIFSDDQREDQLPASLRQVGNILRIEHTDKDKLALPFYFVEDTLDSFLHKSFKKIFRTERFNRGDNTLPYYLFHSLVSWFHAKHERIDNTFGYELMKVSVQDGLKNNAAILYKLFISKKKDLSKRYTSDCLSDTLSVRALRAIWGLDDVPSYKTERATLSETLQQNSYFINRITEQLRVHSPVTDVLVNLESSRFLFLYVDGNDVSFCQGDSISDLYFYFNAAIDKIGEDDYLAILYRLSKYTLKTDSFLEFRQWLSDSFIKGRIDPDRFSLLNEQVDYIQSRCPQR